MTTTDKYIPKHQKTLKSKVISMFKEVTPEYYTPKHPNIAEQEELHFDYTKLNPKELKLTNDFKFTEYCEVYE